MLKIGLANKRPSSHFHSILSKKVSTTATTTNTATNKVVAAYHTNNNNNNITNKNNHTNNKGFKPTNFSLNLKKQLGVESKLIKQQNEIKEKSLSEEIEDFEIEIKPQDFDSSILEEIYSQQLFNIYDTMPLLLNREKKKNDVPIDLDISSEQQSSKFNSELDEELRSSNEGDLDSLEIDEDIDYQGSDLENEADRELNQLGLNEERDNMEEDNEDIEVKVKRRRDDFNVPKEYEGLDDEEIEELIEENAINELQDTLRDDRKEEDEFILKLLLDDQFNKFNIFTEKDRNLFLNYMEERYEKLNLDIETPIIKVNDYKNIERLMNDFNQLSNFEKLKTIMVNSTVIGKLQSLVEKIENVEENGTDMEKNLKEVNDIFEGPINNLMDQLKEQIIIKRSSLSSNKDIDLNKQIEEELNKEYHPLEALHDKQDLELINFITKQYKINEKNEPYLQQLKQLYNIKLNDDDNVLPYIVSEMIENNQLNNNFNDYKKMEHLKEYQAVEEALTNLALKMDLSTLYEMKPQYLQKQTQDLLEFGLDENDLKNGKLNLGGERNYPTNELFNSLITEDALEEEGELSDDNKELFNHNKSQRDLLENEEEEEGYEGEGDGLTSLKKILEETGASFKSPHREFIFQQEFKRIIAKNNKLFLKEGNEDENLLENREDTSDNDFDEDASLEDDFYRQLNSNNSNEIKEFSLNEKLSQAPDATNNYTKFRNHPLFNNVNTIPKYINKEDIKLQKESNVFEQMKNYDNNSSNVDSDVELKRFVMNLDNLSKNVVTQQKEGLFTSLTDSEKTTHIEKQLETAKMPFTTVQSQRANKEEEPLDNNFEGKNELTREEEEIYNEIIKDEMIETLKLDTLVDEEVNMKEMIEKEMKNDEELETLKAESYFEEYLYKQTQPFNEETLNTEIFYNLGLTSIKLDKYSISKLFNINNLDYKKYFSMNGVGGDLDKCFETIKQRSLMIREHSLSSLNEIDYLAKNSKRLDKNRQGSIFVGIKGSGKSASLATCVYRAYKHSNILVLHIPSAFKWTHGVHFIEPSPVLKGYYDAPLPTRDFLKGFMTSNKHLLLKMSLKKDYHLPLEAGQKAPSNLYELCDYALLSESNISVIFKFILDEIINEKKIPILIAIDDYNFLHDYTTYQYGNLDDFTTSLPKKVHAKEYTLVRAINRMLQQNDENKLFIASNTNKHKTESRVYVPKEFIEQVGLDLVYVPSRYTFAELDAMVDYYQHSSFVFGEKNDFMEELLFMTGGVPQRVHKHLSIF
ncbi:hypothetical protein ABK040_013660 [Willaertia magna]